jgi:hypothetical protein
MHLRSSNLAQNIMLVLKLPKYTFRFPNLLIVLYEIQITDIWY